MNKTKYVLNIKEINFRRWYFFARNIRGALPKSVSTTKILSKKFNFNYLLNFFIIILFFLFTKTSHAATFQSSSYVIDWANLNITGGKKTSASFNLTDSVGQNAPGQYNSTGYQVKSGFQYIYDPNWRFVFTLDKLAINFSNMTPGVGITDTNIISIASPSLSGYQIMVYENHPLQINSSKTISDTSCDSNSCSISTSGLWNNNNSYGFGFNVVGTNNSMVTTNIGTSNYFTNESYFRPFANKSINQSPQTIMSENKPTKKSYAKVTYKINIPVFQSTGKYENSITYIAVPKY